MSFGILLSNLILGPLKLLSDVIFAIANRALPVSISIVALCLIMHFLLVPFKRRMNAARGEMSVFETTTVPSQKLITIFHEKKRLSTLWTYCRQHHLLMRVLPFLSQICYFLAICQFLNQLGCLHGEHLGPIQDLGQPDQLLQMGDFTINLLPVLILLITMIAGLFHSKGTTLTEKAKPLAMALILFGLLYYASAGLSLYWMMNSLFSLGAKEIARLRKEKRNGESTLPFFKGKKPNPALFFLCSTVMAVLTGLLIPTSVLASSPQDFITYINEPNPTWYAVNAFLLATGTFVLWLGMFYLMCGTTIKKLMEWGSWVLIGIFLLNYLFFRNNMGTMSSTLRYDFPPDFTIAQKLVNLGVLILAGAAFTIAMAKDKALVRTISWMLILAMGGLSVRNLWVTEQEVSQAFLAQKRNYSGAEEIPLSRNGKNVIVLMLDRAINAYLPCILYEMPVLKSVYSGFTYYPNTLSFGGHTNLAAPALFGGYDYVPRKINERDTVLLKDKHNESLLLLPTLFSRKGYKVSVFDVPYAGDYSLRGDYSIFDSLPNTNARALVGSVRTNGQWERAENVRLRNFFCYSISMVVPSFMYGTVYNMGYYNRAKGSAGLFSFQGETVETIVFADMDTKKIDFMAEYDVLCNLKNITKVLPGEENTLLVMVNGTTHEQVILPVPEYAPVRLANDDEGYAAEHSDRFLAGPIAINPEISGLAYYDVNMAALLKIGEWIEYLKEEDVYDNTRIIVASDHGYSLANIKQGIMDTGLESIGFNALGTQEDIMFYNPLLMVKDFDSTGEIQTDTAFMTNADVPTLALEGLISDPINPFTGNPVNDRDKQELNYVSTSHLPGVGQNMGTTFEPSYWFAVTPGGDTLFDTSRWTFLPDLK